jgi:iron complex outermembrane receptor protein
LDDGTVIPVGTLGRVVDEVFINDNTPAQLALADQVANRYYGVNYDSLTPAQQQQVSAAKSIRAGQIGQLIPYVESNYDDTLYTGFLTQSFEVTDGIKVYGTWQYGEKSGTAFHINGESIGVKPEKTNAYEIGLKTILFGDTLTFNIDAFVMDIEDYQQAVRSVDEFQTDLNIRNGIAPDEATAYITAQGNVNKVKVQGVEFDAVYSGIESLSFRLSGAYNDARYKDFKNSPKPPELNYLPDPFVDQTGTRLPGAALWTINYGAEYRVPVWKTEFHASFNTAFTSDYLNTDDLSSYSRVPSFSRTDVAIGLGRLNEGFDVTLVVKNAFDDDTHEQGWVSYAPYPYRRWVGLTFSGTF